MFIHLARETKDKDPDSGTGEYPLLEGKIYIRTPNDMKYCYRLRAATRLARVSWQPLSIQEVTLTVFRRDRNVGNRTKYSQSVEPRSLADTSTARAQRQGCGIR